MAREKTAARRRRGMFLLGRHGLRFDDITAPAERLPSLECELKSPRITNLLPCPPNLGVVAIPFLQILAASRVARSASQHEETLWRKGSSAAVLAFLLLTA